MSIQLNIFKDKYKILTLIDDNKTYKRLSMGINKCKLVIKHIKDIEEFIVNNDIKDI